jgi:hypothetical protein
MPGAAGAASAATSAARSKVSKKEVFHEAEAAMERFDKIEAVPRLLLIAVLKRRAQRSRRYCSLPAAYLFLGLFMAAMMTRSGVISDAFDFDAKCVPLPPPLPPTPAAWCFIT